MTHVVEDLSRALPAVRASASEADRVAYARDLWPRRHLAVRAGRPAGAGPAAIVWPTSTDEVAALLRYAKSAGVAVVPFGAGSGVCGGVSPTTDTLVMDLKRLARIRRLDGDAPLVEVEAGMMGVPFERALNRAGFTLGHFPSSILCSTVGGWIAARSAGQCSGAYGKIEDMTAGLECVTGDGDVVQLRRRAAGPDLVPLVIGSEGTLAVVTSATLRLHPQPSARTFASWSFPTTRDGWEAMRTLFQAGLRPAVARLYDPFDALIAKRGGRREGRPKPATPGRGGALLRSVLARPRLLNELLDSRAGAWALGGAMLVVIFEGSEASTGEGLHRARRLLEEGSPAAARWNGEEPARRWLEHRYAVSYRQAPLFANGAFVDTMEVAACWSNLEGLYEGVRRALGEHVFVMAHLSHAYPDGCCIYFSFAGAARPGPAWREGWDEACVETYDRAWQAALAAASEAGGTIAHHHGVGRSKAPALAPEMGAGVEVVRALMRAFDPGAILNPGNLLPPTSSLTSPSSSSATPSSRTTPTSPLLDRPSLLVQVDASMDLAALERWLCGQGLTLDIQAPLPPLQVAEWLARGAPGARDPWVDPVDHLLAGLDAHLSDGREVAIKPAPRRSVGPDLTALFVGAGERLGRIDRAWLRVHPTGATRADSAPFVLDRNPPVSDGERNLIDAIARSLGC
jgi:alkyldihydroxyacetonephosphate synthase